MQDPFFATTTGKRKRSKPAKSAPKTTKAVQKRARKDEAEESEISDDNSDVGSIDEVETSEPESEEEIQETAAEKRVRLAKAYLDKVQAGLEEDLGGFDAADLDRDLIAERLKKDEDELAGRLHRRVADKFKLSEIDETKIYSRKGHQLPVTAVALSDNGTVLYTASKDGSIIQWDIRNVQDIKRLHTFPGGRKGVEDYIGHTQDVLCLALSTDNQYLVSGGKDKIINVWSVADNKHITTFRHHKDAISGLAFRKGHNQLYSASWDRTIKVWNIDERAYVETLFGHQDQIMDIDTLGRERCVSVGGRDKTARLWKIPEESQLVYRGGAKSKTKTEDGKPAFIEGSLDCIAQIEEKLFLTGGDSGSISLWDNQRKKPVFTYNEAHGTFTNGSEYSLQTEAAYPITALASLRYSDLFVSGSHDGYVRFWKISSDNKQFEPIGSIPVQGFINSLEIKTVFPSNRTLLIVGVGQEPRYGRWMRLKKAKNCIKVIELPH